MKKSFLLLLVFLCNVAFAQSTTVFEDYVRSNDFGINTEATSKYYFDLASGQGYADVYVTETSPYYGRFPSQARRCGPTMCDGNTGAYPMPTRRVIFNEKFEIDGLQVIDNKIIYFGAEKEVTCGFIGRTRVLHRVQIKLNGNCKLKTTYRNEKLTVTFLAK